MGAMMAFYKVIMFDILVLVAFAMGLIWFFRRKPSAGQKPDSQSLSDTRQPAASARTVIKPCKPEVDRKHFLDAARDIFVRIQNALDAGSLDEIRRFCTSEIADQMTRDIETRGDGQSRTEVSDLNAEIAETWIESDLEWVSVCFSAMLHKQALDMTGISPEQSAHKLHEYWIFRHDPAQRDPTWYLADIQQAG